MSWYRVLLWLYPASFRVDYSGELELLFADRLAEARGVKAYVELWWTTIVDVVGNASRLHFDLISQDLAYCWRTMRRSPGFALSAIAITGLGVGANTAVFSLVDHVFVRPLPFVEADRLVNLWEHPPGYSRMELSPPNYLDWRDSSTSFRDMAAYTELAFNLVGGDQPQRLRGALVTPNLFDLLGSEPALGRKLRPEDALPDAPAVVVVSHSLWHGSLGGRADILGAELRLDGQIATVVGVMAADFVFPKSRTDLWTPLQLFGPAAEDRDNNYLHGIARLEDDVSLAEARAEMGVIADRLAIEYPEFNADTGATVVTLREELGTRSRVMLGTLFAASFCVLLIACTNLAGLYLARSLARRRELAVRSALGAGRERLVRQLMTESLVLAGCGGGVGIVLAMVLLPFLERLVPNSLPIGSAVVLDLRVLAFAALVTFLTGIGFAVLPALRIGRAKSREILGHGRSSASDQRQRARSVLVMVEVALSVVLLIGTGVLVRALLNVRAIEPGFRTERVTSLELPLPMPQYSTNAVREDFYHRVLSEIDAQPGVEASGFISFLPMVMGGGIWPVQVGGIAASQGEAQHRAASLRFVTPDLLEALEIPLEEGRHFGLGDSLESDAVAIVSRSFAEKYWPGRDSLGQVFGFGFRDRRVVGVVSDIKVRGLERKSEPQVYLPSAQMPDGAITFYAPKSLVIRSSGEPQAFYASVRRIVRAADADLPIPAFRLLDDVVADETSSRAAQIRVISAFALTSLLLAAVGIYGLLSFAVSQRRSEIGVRMALGARASAILAMVVQEGVRLALFGAMLGLVVGMAATHSLKALLYGVGPIDVPTLVLSVASVVLVVIAGSLLPALRAARVEPTRALQAEL